MCGQTRPADIRFSFESGADFCGVVVDVPSSPRTLRVEQARPLFSEFGERLFALTADATMAQYETIARALAPGFFQLTANEPPAEVEKVRAAFGIPVFKSLHLPMEGGGAEETVAMFIDTMRRYLDAGCDGFILDTKVPGMFGGSGKKSDWELAGKVLAGTPAKTFLAGGISPENAAAAAALKPYGLDLASGVELSPGLKSREKITALFRALGQPPS